MKVIKMEARVEGSPDIEVKDIDSGNKSLQNEVGGRIEFMEIKIGENYYDLIFNEEGKLEGLPPNLGIVHEGELFDIIMGNLVVARSNANGATIGLTNEDVKIVEKFIMESYVLKLNTGVVPAIPYTR